MWKKRLTAMLLAGVMVLTGLPQAALSVGADDGDIVLPEVGSEDTVTVTFDYNGFKDEDGRTSWSFEWEKGKALNQAAPLYSSDTLGDKHFTGWSLKKDEKVEYQFSDEPLTADLTLYAMWEETWSATFRGNGYVSEYGESEWVYYNAYGSGTMSPGMPAEYEDKIFSGWYWDQACTELAEDLYDTAFDRNIEVWAGWSDYYTLTFDIVDGSWESYETGEMETGNISLRVPVGMEANDSLDDIGRIQRLIYTGSEEGTYRPVFYADEARTQELEDFDPFFYMPSGDETIYVGWQRVICVTFLGNGGYLSRYTIDGEVFTQEDATDEFPLEEDGAYIKFTERSALNDDENLIFTGWYYDAACTSRVPTELYAYEDMTVYAGWTSDYVTVTLDAGPGGFMVYEADTEKWVPGKLTVKAAPGEPLGQYIRNFNIEYNESGDSPWSDEGWYLKSDFSGERILLDEFIANEDTTLYLKWEKYIFVHFHANGGSFAGGDDDGDGAWTIVIGEEDPSFDYWGPEITPPSGKGFSGWYLDPEAKKDPVNLDGLTVTDETDLYAGWTENCHTVTLVLPEDGAWTDYMDQPHTENPVIYVGDGLTLEEVPCRQVWEDISYVGDKGGSRQIQWFAEKEHGPYDSVNPGTISPTENMTLYGEWMIHYTVTFDANGGYFGDPTETEDDWYFQSGKGTITQNRNAQWQDDSLVFEAWYLDKACTQKLDYGVRRPQEGGRILAAGNGYTERAACCFSRSGTGS